MADNKWYIKELIAKVDKDIHDKLTLAGELVSSSAKKNAPFKTGTLRDSINYKVDDADKSVTVGTNVHYAVFQEFGTKYIKPTWFLTRGLAENLAKIRQIFAKRIK